MLMTMPPELSCGLEIWLIRALHAMPSPPGVLIAIGYTLPRWICGRLLTCRQLRVAGRLVDRWHVLEAPPEVLFRHFLRLRLGRPLASMQANDAWFGTEPTSIVLLFGQILLGNRTVQPSWVLVSRFGQPNRAIPKKRRCWRRVDGDVLWVASSTHPGMQLIPESNCPSTCRDESGAGHCRGIG